MAVGFAQGQINRLITRGANAALGRAGHRLKKFRCCVQTARRKTFATPQPIFDNAP
jgi:hypothetical protein